MITYAKFKESSITAGKRVIKFLEFGVKTADECTPFGIDSNPIADMVAIHANTSNNSESVIIGYINKNQLAGAGETRLFSVDANSALKSYVWLKNDGKLQLNGNDYTAVRFTPLKTGLTNQDALINAELIKIQTAITSLGGVYVPSNVITNIDNSESQDVKLK
jgi:hypothetical protein